MENGLNKFEKKANLQDNVDDFKPMLAGSVTDLTKLAFPVLVSPKLDGIRCVVHNGQVLTRKLLSIPNDFIREAILKECKEFELDGELLVNNADFNETQSAVMSEEGEPDFRYFVFDAIGGNNAVDRLSILKKEFDTCLMNLVNEDGKTPKNRILFLQHNVAHTAEDILRYEEECLKQGYEGVMIRGMQGPYKYGRSTEKEGYLLKLKRFIDDEAVVKDFIERMHNDNEAESDELGYTKRSTKKEGMKPTGTLGALVVIYKGKRFKIGTGFTDEQRKEIWDNKDTYSDGKITFKYQELTKYGVPRFPVFKAFRED